MEPHCHLLFAGPEQEAAFKEKFGREPTEDDHWFFDPDSPDPRPYPRDAVRAGTARIFRWINDVVAANPEDEEDAEGWQAMIYAMRKTGLVLDQFSYVRLARKERDAYDGEIDEYVEFSENILMGRAPAQ